MKKGKEQKTKTDTPPKLVGLFTTTKKQEKKEEFEQKVIKDWPQIGY